MEVPSVNLGKIFGTPGKAPETEETSAAPVVDNGTVETTTTADNEIAPTVEAETATTVEKDVKPAVEHETVTNKYEQKEQTVIDKERHQHHYHTTVQPVKDREVLPEDHKYEETATEVKEFDHDDGAAKDRNDARNADFQNTTEEGKTVQKTTEEPTAVAGEEVHHHLHETVQPVIEKETVKPTVVHKTINVKEIHHDAAVDEGTTVEPAISKEALETKLRE